jgi:HEAT repeat protein
MKKALIRKKELFVDFTDALRHLRDDALAPRATLSALSGANRAQLGAFAETWIHLPVERRREVSEKLIDIAEENVEMDFNLLFRHMFNDEDAQVRVNAIEGLWEDEDHGLIALLVGFLRSDPDPRVRAAGAQALGRFVLLGEYDRIAGDQANLIHDALLATIRSANEPFDVRARALESLAYWGSDLMRDVISNAYADDDADMRASAVAAMGRSADGYWSKPVSEELESIDSRMRFNAARAAGELEIHSAVRRLIELIDDPDREVQSAAVTALGQIGGNPARQALQSIADSDDDVLAALASDALDELEFASGSDLLLLETAPDEEESSDPREEN